MKGSFGFLEIPSAFSSSSVGLAASSLSPLVSLSGSFLQLPPLNVATPLGFLPWVSALPYSRLFVLALSILTALISTWESDGSKANALPLNSEPTDAAAPQTFVLRHAMDV